MVVDLPDPDEPTRAVTVPGSERNEISRRHVVGSVIAEAHIIELNGADYVVKLTRCDSDPDLPAALA